MSNRIMILLLAFVGAFVIFVVGVPIVEVQVQEEYNESVPYDVLVACIDTVPHVQSLGSIDSYTVLRDESYHRWYADLEADTNIIFTVKAAKPFTVMILKFDQWYDFVAGRAYDYERKVEEWESIPFSTSQKATLNYDVSSSDTYSFVIESHYTNSGGIWGGVTIYDLSINATTFEEVPGYRTETEYRLEVKTRWVTKKVTIMAKITGAY